MTFTEAALEVLRAAGEPLHYKRITELAIQRNLLSHVGKSPEITMSARLATLVKKDRGEVPIVKVKPGVFAVREVGDEVASMAAVEGNGDGGPESPTPSEPFLPPGADVFPEEEGDDDPILAGLDEGAGPGAGGGGEGEPSGDRPGRRRRRRRRGGRGRGGELPGEGGDMQGRPQGGPPPHVQGRPQGGPPPHVNRGRDVRDVRDVRDARDARDARDGRDGRDGRPDVGGGRRPGREHDDIDLGRAPQDGELLGKDLADAAFAVLSQAERMPASYARVAEMLVRRGRLSGDAQALAPTVAAALRADVALAGRDRVRPRFRLRAGQVSLASWRLPREAIRWEDEAERAAERQRAEVRRAFVARLNELPAAGFAELVASWLNAEGVTALRAVRRPGSSGSVFHFAGTLRGAEERRLAIVVQRAGRDLDRETVIEVRGSLHHYGNATGAWIASTGRVMSGAREEIAAEGGAPCALFDGAALAAAMERVGIGLRSHRLALADIDFDLLESLGDSGERKDRDPRGGPMHDERDRDARPPRVAAQGYGSEGTATSGESRESRESDEPDDPGVEGMSDAETIAADESEGNDVELGTDFDDAGEDADGERPTTIPDGEDEGST